MMSELIIIKDPKKNDEWEEILFEINQTPPTTNTIWRKTTINGKTITYLTKKARDFRKKVREQINKQTINPSKEQVKIKIIITFKDKRKRDIDNYAKTIIDAMKGLFFMDDNQIKELTLIKEQGKKPLTKIILEKC